MTALTKPHHDLGEIWFDLESASWRADIIDAGQVVTLTGRTRRQIERKLGATTAARRFPYDQLLRRSGISQNALRLKVGISGESTRRYEREGLTIWQADRFAVQLGYHPATVWPDWYDEDAGEARRGDAA